MDVRLVYQPYAQNMAIFLDDQPIGMVSALSKYQAQPFTEWYADILPALAFEVNDSFRLTYVGRTCEFRLLQQLLNSQSSCLSMAHEKHRIGDSALMRLKKLSRLVVNGVSCRKFNYPLTVYTDLPLDTIEELVRASLPKLAFCRVNVSVCGLSELENPTEKHTSIALLSESGRNRLHTAATQTSGIVVIGNGTDGCMNGAAVLYAAPDNFSACLEELLELICWPNLLTKALAQISAPKESPFFPEIFALDKTEPQCVVLLPKSIELGMSVPIQVSTIPKSNYKPDVFCRVSNETVITYRDGYLTAVGTGEAVVEVYESGKIIPMHTATVTAFRRNRIRKIQLKPLKISMCVGDIGKIGCAFTPTDADNAGALRLISDEGTIAGIVDQESIVARRPGSCYVFYEAEKVQSNVCEVQVFPKLEKLTISMGAEQVAVNTMTPVSICRTPANATLDRLTVMVQPPELGIYDAGSGQFFARTPGNGYLVVKSDRSDVKDSVPVQILQPKSIPIKPILLAAGAVAVYMLLKSLLGW